MNGAETLHWIEYLRDLAFLPHRYCEDGWYSCPLAKGGCLNDNYRENECNCGATAHNAKVQEVMDELRKLVV